MDDLVKRLRGCPYGTKQTDALMVEAADRIEHLEAQLAAWESELSAVMPPDFKSWWAEGQKPEWPMVAAGVIRDLRERQATAWEQLEMALMEVAKLRVSVAAQRRANAGRSPTPLDISPTSPRLDRT